MEFLSFNMNKYNDYRVIDIGTATSAKLCSQGGVNKDLRSDTKEGNLVIWIYHLPYQLPAIWFTLSRVQTAEA